MQFKPATVELYDGSVFEIGNLGKMKDYFAFETANPNRTQTETKAFLITQVVTKCSHFYPVLIDDVLNLDSYSFNYLLTQCEWFLEQNGKPTFLDLHTLKLVYGLEVNGEIFDLIEFNGIAKASHQADGERLGLSGGRLLAYLAIKEVVRLKQYNGKAIFEGQLNIENIGEMSFIDGVEFLDKSKLRRSLELTALR